MATIEFRYDVLVEDDGIEQDEEGKWRLTAETKEAAFEMLMDGITDDSDDWFPRYMVVCEEDFMAGQICELEKGHEGPHGTI